MATYSENLPPNTSRPRLAEAPVTHSEPSPEHQPTKVGLSPCHTFRTFPRPPADQEPSPDHQPTKVGLSPCHTFRTFPRPPADQGWLKFGSNLEIIGVSLTDAETLAKDRVQWRRLAAQCALHERN
ncbi:hypothetical protein Bbelb_250200 [Branchiostoma belcheri]|nr:hypothetical protein Bbelb_250200 [Branchiostoma belcheri]